MPRAWAQPAPTRRRPPPAAAPAAPSRAAPAPPRPPAAGAFDATAADRIVPDRDAPIMFAKSPRSCIIDPDEPFYIVDGRGRTDYEGELAIIMGPRPAYRIPRERALDYVFGYSIMQDVSDRGSERLREVTMFPGANWFDGKSIDRAAPFGPVIVPKEFMPKGPSDLRMVTRVNGEVMQDARTSNLIWSEPHLVAYVTSRMTLYPGDVIVTGTPAGTGMERQKFLKPGDVVEVEIEGIGTLRTPFKALSEKPGTQDYGADGVGASGTARLHRPGQGTSTQLIRRLADSAKTSNSANRSVLAVTAGAPPPRGRYAGCMTDVLTALSSQLATAADTAGASIVQVQATAGRWPAWSATPTWSSPRASPSTTASSRCAAATARPSKARCSAAAPPPA